MVGNSQFQRKRGPINREETRLTSWKVRVSVVILRTSALILANEEPSSALATKVLRAWDNPSPPPSPTLKADSLPTPEELQGGEVIPAVPEEGEEVDAEPTAQITGDSSAADFQALLSGETANDTVEPAGEPCVDDVEEDLIMFDSFNSPSAGPRMRVMPPTPVRTHDTVDDLLAISPMPALISTVDNQALLDPTAAIDIPEDVVREDTPSVLDEQEVALTLSTAASPSPVLPPAKFQPLAALNESQDEAPLVVLTPTPTPDPDPVPQTPPVRRSTRARRSASPFIVALTVSPSKAISISTPGPSTPQPRPGSATRRRKTKSKDVEVGETPLPQEREQGGQDAVNEESAKTEDALTIPQSQSMLEELTAALANETNSEAASQPVPVARTNTEVMPVEEADRSSTPKAKRRAHRLGSLSPTSSQVLDQLVPPSSSSSLQGPNNSQPNNNTIFASASSPFLFTPPPVFGQNSTFSGSTTPAAFPSIPLRPQASSKAHDITRTPARRVPITEAVAKGSISPEKARDLLIQRPDPTLGSTSNSLFAERAPNDPPRSPAKRVPIEQALNTLQSPHKSKVPVPPSSPVRERSRSVDIPSTPGALRFRRSTSAEPRIPLVKSSKEGLFRKPPSADGPSKPSEPSTSLPFPIHSFTSTRLPTSIAEVDEAAPQPSQSKVTPTAVSKPTSSLRQPSVKAESKIPRPGAKPYARPGQTSAITGISRVPAPSAAKKVDAGTSAAPVAV